MTVQQTFYPKPPTNRGPHASDDESDMLVALQTDLANIIALVNANEISILDANKMLFSEFTNARNAAARHIEAERNAHLLAALRSEVMHNFVSFRSFAGPNYYISYDGIAAARRARVEPIYGQALLPYNNIQNMMFTINPETDEPILPDELDYLVTGEGEDGAHDVAAGTVKNAFNGNNRSYWIRKVRFPLEADVDSVAATLDITLPITNVSYVNMLNLHPFPLGQVEVEELKYSVDSSDPSIDVPGFSTIRGAGFERWHFSELAMTKLRIKLRQRHSVEEDGYKVFYLGAQEVGLQLVGFDKTVGLAQPSDNNGLVVVLEAPAGYKFNVLERLYSDPDYSVPLSDAGILIKIFGDAALTNLQWSSYDHSRLEDAPKDVSPLAVNKLYMLVNLSFVTGEAKSPLLNDIVVGYSVTQ
jgi:hypothetical protein